METRMNQIRPKKTLAMSIRSKSKMWVTALFPSAPVVYSSLRNGAGTYFWGDGYAKKVFSTIYRNNSWSNPESLSGLCSTHARTGVVREKLPELVKEFNIKSLLDAPCGDFNWMRLVKLGVDRYIGADIVPDLVARNQQLFSNEPREFRVLDITRDRIPTVDLILCRDCLIHFSFQHIRAAISNFKNSGSQYLLTTTHTRIPKNTDIALGDCFMFNLQLPPFNFPEPIKLISEEAQNGRSLALWRLRDL
jgi:hypothetical protein